MGPDRNRVAALQRTENAEVLSVIEDERVTEEEFQAGTTVLKLLDEGQGRRQKLADINERADALDKAIDSLEARCVR